MGLGVIMAQNAIICDLDDTLVEERNNYKPIRNVIDFINQQAQTHKIIIMTARSAPERRDQALELLRKNKISFDKLITNDKNKDADNYKYEETKKLMDEYNIVLFIDEDKSNRKAIKELGIKTKKPENISNNILTKTVWSGIFI
jgi:hydroxymethylpyrimidine pyrophosphatase-like HAD family hydrolase